MLAALEKALGTEYTRDVLAGKRSVIASCGSGMTAGVIWLALQVLGAQKVAIYDEVRRIKSFGRVYYPAEA